MPWVLFGAAQVIEVTKHRVARLLESTGFSGRIQFSTAPTQTSATCTSSRHCEIFLPLRIPKECQNAFWTNMAHTGLTVAKAAPPNLLATDPGVFPATTDGAG